MTTDPTPTFSTRLARADEADALYAIHRETMRDYVAQTYGEWLESFQAEAFRDRFTLGRYEAIDVDGALAGYIDCERDADGWHLNNIRVVPALQGHGIGSALVRKLLTRAEAEGVPVMLRVLRVNPARALYERLGFVLIEETETHYVMRANAQT